MNQPSPSLTIFAKGSSKAGSERDRNEDAFLMAPEQGLYAVSDGIGGNKAGEVAAFIALEVVKQKMGEIKKDLDSLPKSHEGRRHLVENVESALQSACAEIHQRTQEEDNLKGMGATCTMLQFAGDKVVMGHVGHSAVYLFRDDILSKLSVNHTAVNELIELGLVEPEDAPTHHLRNILSRALGFHKTVLVDTLVFTLLPGDRLLLCTDGVTRHTTPESLQSALSHEGSIEALQQHLDQVLPQDEGDDLTYIVMEVQAGGDDQAQEGTTFSSLVTQEMELMDEHYLTKGLKVSDKLRLLHSMKWKNIEADEVFQREGALYTEFALIIGTPLKVSKDGHAIPNIARTSWGEIALLTPYTARYTLTATEETAALTLSHGAFQQLLKKRPRLASELLRRLGLHLLGLQTQDLP